MAENQVIVGIADIKVGESPTKFRTTLGSCIAVCLYSESKKVGGMLHLMLAKGPQRDNLKVAKYADTGIPELIKQMKKRYGLTEKDLIAKIFGGAKVLKITTQDIGEDNIKATKDILKEMRYTYQSLKSWRRKGLSIGV